MPCIGTKSSEKAKTVVLVIGAFSAGKTTILRKLARKSLDTVPTLGISEETISIEEFEVLFLDIGGKKELHADWALFYGHVHGIVYAVDATDMKNCVQNSKRLRAILEHPDVDGKPFLIVFTKSESAIAMKETMLIEAYEVDRIIRENRSVNICFSTPENEPHFVHGIDREERDSGSIILDALGNISCNRDAHSDNAALANAASAKATSSKVLSSDAITFNAGRNAASVGTPPAELRILIVRHFDDDPDAEYGRETNANEADHAPPSSSSYGSRLTMIYDEEEEVYPVILYMGLREGMLWLLEFINGRKKELDRILDIAKQRHSVSSAQAKLRKIQRKWEKQCAKEDKDEKNRPHPVASQATTGTTAAKHPHLVVSAPGLVAKISRLNAKYHLEETASD